LYTLPRRVGDVEGRAVLSDGWDKPRCAPGTGYLYPKKRWLRGAGVGGEEVGVKCGCMQGCCEGARQGVRSGRTMVQVAMNTKTNKVGAVTHQS